MITKYTAYVYFSDKQTGDKIPAIVELAALSRQHAKRLLETYGLELDITVRAEDQFQRAQY